MSEDRLVRLLRIFRRALLMIVGAIEKEFPEVKE